MGLPGCVAKNLLRRSGGARYDFLQSCFRPPALTFTVLVPSQFGKEAINSGVKGVVLIGAHWEEKGEKLRVATKFEPGRVQMDMVPREYWEKYPINVSRELADRVVDLLRAHQFHDVEADPTFDWHDDTITPCRWMFPDGTPPTTVISLNARFQPTFHAKIGIALGQLRAEGILIVGTGGAVHNLYRNNWIPMLKDKDNFQVGRTPAPWAIEFEQSVSDVIKRNEVRTEFFGRRQYAWYQSLNDTDMS